ncbi:DUF7133 domain-containing protein [Spongiibacter thalassae]|uniref:DUF7133 domain-containing protein n=1 Tax=Spongiibacter thalassae TaxID=2721624 RepID=UPI001FF0CB6B|nr:PQQ-dependent sugar dehydrogenase [Spongiibacter thalassae]
MLKKVIKIVGALVLVTLLGVIVTPFVLLQWGSPGMAAASRAILHSAIGYSGAEVAEAELRQGLSLAGSLKLQVFASGLNNARFMAVSEHGDVLLSRPRNGEVILLTQDRNGDGMADARRVLIDGLNRPHGLELKDGWLYIAESNAIGKVPFDSKNGQLAGDYRQIVVGLGDNGNHWTKTIGFGPDGWLYLTSGSTCNVCEEVDPQRATMMRVQPDGSGLEIYATGLRNSVGFDWAPWNDELYATDNGRDLLGDDFPPCELNRVERGGFYGWPYFNADQRDPDYGARLPQGVADHRLPVHEFRAHNAPLGIHFWRNPPSTDYQRTALVALHGSWNRSQPDGYKVVALSWDDKGRIVERDFLSGFLQSDKLLGRPVDIAEAPDGSLYVSDDYRGTIYRIGVDGANMPASAISSAEENMVSVDSALSAYTVAERAELKERGEQLYRQYPCASCHNANARPLKALPQRYSLAELADFFVTPTPPMPQYPLDSGEREALAVYLFSLAE